MLLSELPQLENVKNSNKRKLFLWYFGTMRGLSSSQSRLANVENYKSVV